MKNKENAITLVALVVTIVVLLILAGITIVYVFGDNGVFGKARDAKEQTEIAKAREKLELVLFEAQIQKYEKGLNDEELNNQIAKIGGELLPKEKPNLNLQNVIVDGYIFEIDRSVPKIANYIGPANGVIITAVITGNDGWVKPGETISVSGVIKTYNGGTITSSSATANGTAIPEFPTTGGEYKIDNITADTTIIISATDSNKRTISKTIPITIKIDDIAPTVDSITAEAEGLNITFSATGIDNESGLKHFNYAITSTQDTTLEGIPADKRSGTFAEGKIVEITATKEATYTITITATDNCDNTTLDGNKKTGIVTTKKPILINEIKLDRTELAILPTQEVTLEATIGPTNATEKLKWSSDNPDVASIEQTGKITGHSVGMATITVSPKNSNSVIATCEVSVLEGVPLLENSRLNTEPLRRI